MRKIKRGFALTESVCCKISEDMRSVCQEGRPMTEDKKAGCQMDKLFNEYCHPEFISGSVHCGKWKLPWNKMLKHLTDTGSHDNFQTLNHHTDAGSQGSSLACSLCKVQGDKIVGSLCKVQHDKFGFTLAEVLITIGIIGVVAAITIPTMISNYQKYKTVSKLQRAISVISQTYKMSYNELGGFSLDDLQILDKENFVKKYFAPYIKILTVCSTYEKCGYTTNTPFINVDGTNTGSPFVYGGRIAFISHDGYMYYFEVGSYMTVNGKYGVVPGNIVIIDLNAGEKPNIKGKDVFVFRMSENGNIVPYNHDRTYEEINENCKTNGNSCAEKSIRDGWKIKKDYPW